MVTLTQKLSISLSKCGTSMTIVYADDLKHLFILFTSEAKSLGLNPRNPSKKTRLHTALFLSPRSTPICLVPVAVKIEFSLRTVR